MAASIGEIERRLAEIDQQLDRISGVKTEVEDDVWAHSLAVRDLEGVSLDEREIQTRIMDMAEEIAHRCKTLAQRPVLVGLLDGGVPFCQALSAALERFACPHDITWMQVSSYGKGMTSGTLHFGAMAKVPLFKRDVILADDLCDTGKTLLKTANMLLGEEIGARSVYTAVLVEKVQEREKGCAPDISGFKIPPTYIIGYGLDYYGGLLRAKKSVRSVHPEHQASDEQKALLDSEESLRVEYKALSAQLKALQALPDVPAPAQFDPSFFGCAPAGSSLAGIPPAAPAPNSFGLGFSQRATEG